MALAWIRETDEDVRLGLWRMEEKEYDFSTLPMSRTVEKRIARFTHAGKRLEQYCVYALVRLMCGRPRPALTHNADGKPLLRGWRLSISHTRGFAAVIMSGRKNVAVDVEQISGKVDRVAQRFLRRDEPFSDTIDRLIAWSAKETCYKFYSEDDLTYGEMRVRGLQEKDLPEQKTDSSKTEHARKGVCLVENLKRGTSVQVSYEVESAYVLTYAWE